MDAVRIARALPADMDAVLALVAANGLPTDGLRDHLSTTLIAWRAGVVVGSSALELYDDGALLRSVAVDPRERGQVWGIA